MTWKTVAARLLAGLALLGPGAASAQTADAAVEVTVQVLPALAAAVEGPRYLAANAIASDSMRVRVDGQGAWLLRVVPAGVTVLAQASRTRGGPAAGRATGAAALKLLRLSLGVSGTGAVSLTLPALRPSGLPTDRATVVVEVAAN